MKAGTTDKMKFRRLARRLGLATWEAAGLLEMLWAVTSANAPTGDIGRLPNDEIALLIDWDRTTPDELIAALIENHWLDEDPEFRLIVHDWSSHAPNFIKGNLSKHRREFADVVAARRGVEAAKQVLKASAKHVPPSHVMSSQVMSCQAKPPREDEKQTASVPTGCTDAGSFRQAPRRGRLTFERVMLPVPTSHLGEPFEPAWNRWLDYLIAKDIVTTEDTARGQLTTLCRYGPAEATEIIRRTIEERGWNSLDLPKDKRNGTARKQSDAYTAEGFAEAGDRPIGA